VRLNPHHFTLTHDLSGTDDMVLPYRHRETHITMGGKCRISLEKYAPQAYVIADGSKLRNSFPSTKLYLDWVAQAKSTIPAILRHKMLLGTIFNVATVRHIRQVHVRALLRGIWPDRAWPLGPKGSSRAMQFFMAAGAQGDQIRVLVVALLTPQLFVMDLKVPSSTANLTSPAIALQHLFSQLVVWLGIEPQAWPLGSNPGQEAFSVTSCRKASRCSPGRNLKNLEIDCSSTVGSSFSRFAPARKSAHIISKQ
jgi:hypothetical protein